MPDPSTTTLEHCVEERDYHRHRVIYLKCLIFIVVLTMVVLALAATFTGPSLWVRVGIHPPLAILLAFLVKCHSDHHQQMNKSNNLIAALLLSQAHGDYVKCVTDTYVSLSQVGPTAR